jgi:DNA-binding response OmpR family regulator
MGTILVVDDAPEIRDLLTAFLSDEGFDVLAYDAAEGALTQIDLAVPDLLVLDGRMARMSGWQCLQCLRASARTLTLPVLMLTAAPDDLKQADRPADNFTTYLAKPFDLDELLAAIFGVMATCDETPTGAMASG